MTRLTSAQIAEIKARTEAATPGPWHFEQYEPFPGDVAFEVVDTEMITVADNVLQRDVSFFAHSRTDIPALLAEVERLRAALEFYADEKNWLNRDPIGASEDTGEIARNALQDTDDE
jgi:hypothetical protein